MSGDFPLNAEQKNKLQEITNNGEGNYAAGYDYLRQQIQTFLDAPENANHPDRQAYKNTNYWLEKAAEINRNDPKSEANAYIRKVTRSGLLFDGKNADPAKVQENSDIIGKTVVRDIVDFNRIPGIDALLQHDVQSALGNGGQTLAGWGGSFYYWDMPMSKEPGDTVGNRIMSDPVEYEKFLAVSTKAAIETMSRLGMSFEQFETARKAQVPENVMSEIMDRAASVLDYGDGQSDYMGNPNEIGGYRASIGQDGAVSWYQLDKDLQRVPLQDEATISKLNTRRNLRLEKGLNHSWQTPKTEARVDKITLNDGTVYEHTYGADGRIQQTAKTSPDGTRIERGYDQANSKVTYEKRFGNNGKQTSQTDFNTDGTKTERYLDPQTGVTFQENLFDSNGTQVTAKTFDRVAGHLTAQTEFNVDGYRIEKTFAPASAQEIKDWLWIATDPIHGFVTQDKRTSLATGALVQDLRFDIQQRVFTSYFVEPAYQQLLTTQAIEPEMKRRQEEVWARVIDRLIESIPAAERDREGMREHAKEVLVNIEIGPIRLDLDPYSTEYEKLLQEFLGAKAKEFGLNVTVGPVTASNADGTNSSSGSDRGNGGDRRDDDSYQGSITVGEVTIGPVFLDLNSDKIIDPLLFSRSQNQPQFDWSADGILDQTAWVGPKDGMLVIDLAKDGTVGTDAVIDQPQEVAFALWKTEEERVAELKEKGIDNNGRPITDLEGLRWAFDSNYDNALDMRDARWNEFRVWQDANQNGITDAGELMTMDQAGIRLINLMPSSDGSKAFPDGSAITGTSSAEMTDGTKMLVGDVSLAFRPSLAG